jgi:DNA-binding response OmpR family regulator
MILKKQLRILVIDNSQEDLMSTLRTLLNFGADVFWAEDKDKALELVRDYRFDLIIINIQLLELVLSLRNATHEIPIIALSKEVDVATLQKCYNYGMDRYIHKPINPGEFFDTIDQYLN